MICFALISLRQAYAREVDEHKRTLLLVNKADLLPASVRFECFIPIRGLCIIKSLALVLFLASLFVLYFFSSLILQREMGSIFSCS